jgi:F-type H+-transporting ATPase subunit epsilon
MKLVIAQLDKVFFDGEALSATFPGREGELTVYPSHMPLVTTLAPGTITVRAKELPGGEQTFPVGSGVLEVRHDGATVIL